MSLSQARYAITEIKSIRDVLPKTKSGTWVLIDLDDTTMHPWCLTIGCHTWFTMLSELANAKVTDKTEAFALTLTVYNEVQHRLHMQAVEQDVFYVINSLNTKDVPVIALTSRGEGLRDTTHRQLHNLGIHFQDIIFCSGKHKGNCLKAYLDGKKYTPGHIIMIDDQKKYVDQVGEAAYSLSIDYDGLHYLFPYEQVKAFNFEQSHKELAALYPTLPEQAQNAIQRLGIVTKSEDTNHKHYFQFFYSNSRVEQISTEKTLAQPILLSKN